MASSRELPPEGEDPEHASSHNDASEGHALLGRVTKSKASRAVSYWVCMGLLCIGLLCIVVMIGHNLLSHGNGQGSSTDVSSALFPKLFVQPNDSPFMVGKNLCVTPRSYDCESLESGLAEMRETYGLEGKWSFVHAAEILPHMLDIQEMTPDLSQSADVVPGSTLLVSIYHVSTPAWQNIEHYSETVVPLDGDLHEFGRDLAQNMLLWQAKEDVLLSNSDGFNTDWYQEFANILMWPQNGSSGHSSQRLLACEDLFARQMCFEQLVIYRKPVVPFTTVGMDVSRRLRARVLQWYDLQPGRPLTEPYTILAFLRVDNQGWSNFLEAGEEIKQYALESGNRAQVEFLNKTSMTLIEQVRWLNEASVFVSTHGAHETNVLFMAEGTVLIEYFKLQHLSWDFSAIAAARGVFYHAAHAAGLNTSECASRKNLNVWLPLDFFTELAPHLELGLEQLRRPDDHQSCRYMAYGGKCFENLWQAGEFYKQLFPAGCPLSYPPRFFATLGTE